MASTSSQSKRHEGETVPKCPVMSRDIFDAAMKGNNDVLIECLGLQTKEQTQSQEDGDSDEESTKDLPFGPELMPLTQRMSYFATKSNVTIKDYYSAPENQTVKYELQSATRSGDTLLHLLVTKMHNELALMVFERNPSLLKMQNKILETPLHCAAKVGNQEVILKFIDIEPAIVKDVVQVTNEKGDTVLHVAVRYNFADICRSLMEFDSEIAYHVNKEMFSPLHIAIDEEYESVAKQMLRVDPILACTQLTDGMFPVHLAARKKNSRMVWYFMTNFPDYAELVDSRGRNLFHIVAEEADKPEFIRELSTDYEDMTTRMNNATDYEGNTPLHIAAMKGHRWTMRSIWKMTNCVAETVKNKRGLTPYEVSRNQLQENSNKDSRRIFSISRIRAHDKRTIGSQFSEEWFTYVMAAPPPPPPPPPPLPRRSRRRPPPPLDNIWEKIQVIGLGSVLITTVAFAASFTVPGGYNQDNGTPVLGRRYMFWAYILANTFAFIQGFISLFVLLLNAVTTMSPRVIEFAVIFFLLAASSMVVAFGSGLYVTLAPICLPIAILLLVITLFLASPALLFVSVSDRYIPMVVCILDKRRYAAAAYMVPLMVIFGLALLSR